MQRGRHAHPFLFDSADKTSTVYNTFIIGDGGVAGQAKFLATATGTLAITNNGNGKLIVGAAGNGTLTVQNGAIGDRFMVVWADQIILGRDNNVTGTLAMAASGASANTGLMASNMVVGSSGVGTLNQSQGMTNLISGRLVLGENNTGGGTYTLNNAAAFLAVTNSGGNANLIVGQNGAGNLTLTLGNLVVDNLSIATNAGSRGTFAWTAGSALTVKSLGAGSSDGMAIFTSLMNAGGSGPAQWGSNSLQAAILNTNLVGTANFNNGWVLGASAAGTGVVSLGQTTAAGSGNYYVTNSAGASLIVGQNGVGSLTFNAGNLFVNQLLVTNNTTTTTNSFFNLNAGGTLTTSNAANAVATYIRTVSNVLFNINGTWNMAGGSNFFQSVSNGGSLGGVNIGNGAANAAVNVSSGTVWDLGGLSMVLGISGTASTGNVLRVVSGGIVTNVGGLTVGQANSNNTLFVGGVGNASTLTVNNNREFRVGVNASFNTVTITNGTLRLVGTTGTRQVGFNSTNNVLHILAGGVFDGNIDVNATATGNVVHINSGTWTNAGAMLLGGGTGGGLIVSNGGVVSATSVSLRGSNNFLNVGGYGLMSTVAVAGAVHVGSLTANGVGYNTLTVTNALLLSTGAAFIGNGTSNNTATVQARGTWNLGSSTLTVGTNAAIGNVLRVQSGGLLEANSLITGAGAGNAITNAGGVYQFTIANPTNTPNAGAGSIALFNGTISFRGVTGGLNLTNNWKGSGLTNMAFSGDNALRLDSSSATNTYAGGYTFDTGQPMGPSNYVSLTMVNGNTAITGNGITIGATGSLLVSNSTLATFSGPFTNAGTAQVIDSTAVFSSTADVTGTLTTRTARPTFNGLTGNGLITNTSGASTVVFNGGNATFAGSLGGADLAVVMNGGTQTLTGINTYDGGTTFHESTRPRRHLTVQHDSSPIIVPLTPARPLPFRSPSIL